MAIKTVSKLDDFENKIDGTDNETSIDQVGGSLRYYTQTKPRTAFGENRPAAKRKSLIDTEITGDRPSGAPQGLTAETATYYQSLIELSQPETPGSGTSENYYSKRITYRDFLKNVIFDVKQYLNERNGLYETNIEELTYETTQLGGKKYFLTGTDNTNGVDIDGQLSVTNSLIIRDASLTSNSSGTHIENDLTAHQATLTSDSFANNTCDLTTFFPVIIGKMAVNDYFKIGGGATGENDGYLVIATGYDGTEPIYIRQYNTTPAIVNEAVLLDGNGNTIFPKNITSQNGNIYATNGNIYATNGIVDSPYFTGGAYCLKNNDNSHTTVTCGTNDSTTTAGLTGGRVGDPVMFKDGRPYELSCVNYATNAYNLINSSGTKYTVGSGELRNEPYKKSKSAVYFYDGVPVETNVIDYALHAYWSDLGEKYLGDQKLEPGTLVQFGGEKEITIATDKANAIVSTNAFDLNHDLKDGTVIALCGRVPTKIIGKVKKFDKIVLSDIPGVGRSKKWYEFWKRTIGISLENSDLEEVKLVECVTRFHL